MLTPYQFASNRPIDGIDFDGLEYATFTIFVQDGKVNKISLKTDYELKDKGSLGPGVKYNYAYLDNAGKLIKFEAKPLVVNLYGVYQGDKNPKLPRIGGDPNQVFDNYDLPPIDEADANAKQHDQDYDKDNLSGLTGVLNPKSTQANEAYIVRANIIIDKEKKGDKDVITGKPVTKEAAKAARFGRKGFGMAEGYKKSKFEHGPKY